MTMTNDETHWKPGQKLRAIREEAGISLDTIAKDTLIPFSKLQCLESDQYEQIGKDVYVIAYIRKFAKTLGISSDPFVEQFKFLTGTVLPSDVQTIHLGGGEETAASSFARNFRKARGLEIIVVLALVWLVSVLFLSQDEEPVETITADSDNTLNNTVESESSLVTEAQVNESLDTEVQSTPGALTEVTEPDSKDSFGDASDADLMDSESIEQDVRSQANTPVADSSGPDSLIMSFYGECWVKVWNAEGEVIFAQLQNSGDNLRLSGKAPFTVMLGNAVAVDLLINGQRISTEPPEGRRTLRIKVGP